jgi:hypothetical protein
LLPCGVVSKCDPPRCAELRTWGATHTARDAAVAPPPSIFGLELHSKATLRSLAVGGAGRAERQACGLL